MAVINRYNNTTVLHVQKETRTEQYTLYKHSRIIQERKYHFRSEEQKKRMNVQGRRRRGYDYEQCEYITRMNKVDVK